MSVPNEIEFGILKIGNGADPEVFTAICGLTAVTINETAQTSDRFRHDCAKMNAPATRRIRVTSTQWDATGSGLTNADQIALMKAALGKHKNFQIDAIQDDGTDTGEVVGTFEGPGVLTARNFSLNRDGDTTMEVTVAGEGDLVYTAA